MDNICKGCGELFPSSETTPDTDLMCPACLTQALTDAKAAHDAELDRRFRNWMAERHMGLSP